MKQLLTCLFILVTFCVSAQDMDSLDDFFWRNSNTIAEATAVPEKYKNESAVILFQYEYYDFPKSGVIRKWESGVRKRIKLQDEAAVKEFSQFSFKYHVTTGPKLGGEYNFTDVVMGIKIIKPDGKEIHVNLSHESVTVDDEKKIAISNLEVGDIIDYYVFTSSHELTQDFAPVESVIGEAYPILNLDLEVEMAKQYSINWKSYNGAPELKELPLGDKDQKRYEVTMSGDTPELIELPSGNKDQKRYELTMNDIRKNEFSRWFYPFVELPCYKFLANIKLGEDKKTITSTISKDDILDSYDNRFKPYGNMEHIEDFLHGKTFSSDEEKVREVYYFTRHFYFTQYVEAFVVNEAKIFMPFELYKNPIFLKNETEFIDHFMAFLKDNKIDYDIVVATPRFNGPMGDLILWSNLQVLLRVNTSPDPVYLGYFSPFTNADQFSPEIENSDAYLLDITKRKKVTGVEPIHLPSSTADDNVTRVAEKVSMNADMTGLKVARESSYFGHLKEEEQNNRLNFFDYVNEDYQKYGTQPLMDRIHKDKRKPQFTQEFDALINKLKDKQKETFLKTVSDEFEMKIDKYDYKVVNSGRFGKKEPFTFSDEFELENNLVKKAGDNYIVEIGKLITGQIEINKKEKGRTTNIYMPFPRSFENQIIFEIPKGYTVSGLEKLAKNVSNSTGAFTSTAKIDGNKLVINTKKAYNNYYEPNNNWPKMIDFLDAAYQFTQEKILLKKA
jgi:hypothetical protein